MGMPFVVCLLLTFYGGETQKRIRFTKIQEKKLYQNPKKHIEAFSRALIMYSLIAVIDGYLLALF